MADSKQGGAGEGPTEAVEVENKLRQDQASSGGQGDYFQMDRWFDAQLLQMYSDVLNEPLPKTFLDLLEKLRERGKSR